MSKLTQSFNQFVWRPVYDLMDAIIPNNEFTCRVIEALFLALIAAVIGGPVTTTAPPSLATASVGDVFKNNRARKNVIVGASILLGSMMLLSIVSSFAIFIEGFRDLPTGFQYIITGACVLLIEGALCWLLYGFSKVFSTSAEKILALLGILFLLFVMTINIITHFMRVKGLPLSDFQNGWLSWGAPVSFIVVFVLVVLLNLLEPVARLLRQENKVMGKQQETLLQARDEALDSDRVKQALVVAAKIEADNLAEQIIEMARERAALSDGSRSYYSQQSSQQPAFKPQYKRRMVAPKKQ